MIDVEVTDTFKNAEGRCYVYGIEVSSHIYDRHLRLLGVVEGAKNLRTAYVAPSNVSGRLILRAEIAICKAVDALEEGDC